MKTKLLFLLFVFYKLTLISQIANQPSDVSICDNENDGDNTNGIVQNINLDSKSGEILGAQDPNLFTVSFHRSQSDADSFINLIVSPYSNFTPDNETIYARVTEESTNKYAITSFNIFINPVPLINSIENIEICDDDNDGLASFDLTLRNNDILNDQNDIDIHYFSSLSDALNDVNVLNFDNNYIASSQTVYFRLQNINTGCSSISSYSLIVKMCSEIDTDTDTISNDMEDVNRNGNLEDDDTDADNIPNYLDDDDDNDGILTKDEDYNNNGDPTDDDTNNDGIPDYLDESVALTVDLYSLLNLKIYPNPIKNVVHIEHNTIGSNKFKLEIYSALGKRVLSQNINTDKTKINLSLLKSGIYFLKVYNSENTIVKRIVIDE